MISITRRIEFDAGHRIPNHASKCRNIHGHRYVLEATVTGVVNPERGQSDDGMVLDFGNFKHLLMEVVGEPWDHAFLVCDSDRAIIQALNLMSEIENHSRTGQSGWIHHKTVVLPFAPTVENLVDHAFRLIEARVMKLTSRFRLTHVRLFETPNCWADAVLSHE